MPKGPLKRHDMNDLIRLDDVPNVLHVLEEAAFDIPFGNSDFQNQAFVIAAQITPARAYRAALLGMFSRIRAIKEYKFDQRKLEIDIDEKRFKLTNVELDQFERRRIELDLEQIEDERSNGRKLLNDALRELNCLYAEFVKLPRYTREQFEAEEAAHYKESMVRQLNNNGPMVGLINMDFDLRHWEERVEQAGVARLKG